MNNQIDFNDLDYVYKTCNHTIKFDTFNKPLDLYNGIKDTEITLEYSIRQQEKFKLRLNQIKKGNKTKEKKIIK